MKKLSLVQVTFLLTELVKVKGLHIVAKEHVLNQWVNVTSGWKVENGLAKIYMENYREGYIKVLTFLNVVDSLGMDENIRNQIIQEKYYPVSLIYKHFKYSMKSN